MSNVRTLLPPSAGPLRKQLEAVMAEGCADLDEPISKLWNAETCPADILPWLAWAVSVDVWDSDWPEATKRSAIAASFEVHRKKGTPHAIKTALRAFGYGEAVLVEGHGAEIYDGAHRYDGSITYGQPDHWAEYRVYLERPITQDQAEQLKAILAAVAPARCRLKALYFTAVAHRYNGVITYDGTYTYGAVS